MTLHGVFVGIDKYKDQNISGLQYAAADAEGMHSILSSHLAPEDCNLRLITDDTATKPALLKAIGEDLSREATEDDVVLLFFAGHGSPETGGSIDSSSRYLVLYDTEYENIFSTGLDMEHELPRICFERVRSKLIVLFVDACFSGRSGGRTFEGPNLFRRRQRQGVRGFVKLGDFDLGEGRIVITASDDDEVAREDPRLRHGVFTYYLMKALNNKISGDSSISIAALYDHVSAEVHKSTSGRQHPILNGRSRLGRLPIFR
jgi:uncharacterized caspase-like protein